MWAVAPATVRSALGSLTPAQQPAYDAGVVADVSKPCAP